MSGKKDKDKKKDKDLKVKTANKKGTRLGELSQVNDARAVDHFSLASLNKRPQLEAVLNRGIGVNAKDVNGQTFLHHAAKNGAVEVLRWLIANPKIMLDSQDNEGNTALHAAVLNRMQVTAKILVEAGADNEIKNTKQKTWYQLTSDQQFILTVGEGRLGMLVRQQETAERMARKDERAVRRAQSLAQPEAAQALQRPEKSRTTSMGTYRPATLSESNTRASAVFAAPSPTTSPNRASAVFSNSAPQPRSQSVRITKEVVQPSPEDLRDNRYIAPQTIQPAVRTVSAREAASPRVANTPPQRSPQQNQFSTLPSTSGYSTLPYGQSSQSSTDALYDNLASLVRGVGVNNQRRSLSLVLGMDELMNQFITLIFTIQKIPGVQPLYNEEMDAILVVVQSFLRTLKVMFDGSDNVFIAWPDSQKAEEVKLVMYDIKKKSCVSLYNSVKAVKENIATYHLFITSVIETNIQLWRLYSTAEANPTEEVLTTLKDSFLATKSMVDSLSNGTFNMMQISKVQKSMMQFSEVAIEFIFSSSSVQQQCQLYNNIFTLVQVSRAIVMSCQAFISGAIANPNQLFTQLNELLVKCATQVKVITDDLRGVPQAQPQDLQNAQLMSHGLILLQDVCDKANCVSTDDRLFIGSIARFLEGIKKMNGAYSQNPLETFFVVESISETCIALSQLISQFEGFLVNLPLNNQDSIRSLIGTLKQAGLQIKILGSLNSMSQVPQTLHFALIGFITRHLCQILCLGVAIIFER